MRLFWRHAILVAGDFVLLYLALAFALALRHMGAVPSDFYLRHAIAFTILFPSWIVVFYVLGLYDFRRMQTLTKLVNDSALAMAINFMVSMCWLYMLPGLFGLAPKTHLLLLLCLSHCGFAFWRHVWVRQLSKKVAVQRVAFVGSDPLIPIIRDELARCGFYGMRCVPCPDLRALEIGARLSDYWHPDACATQKKCDVDVLVVVAEEVEKMPSLGRAILSIATAKDIPVRTLLDFYEETFHRVPPESAAKSRWLLTNVLHKGKEPYMFVKRALDLALSLAGLLLSLPLFALTALIYLGSPFYTQKRLGYHGEEFLVWKLRTMVPGADQKGPLHDGGSADSRITRLGRFLRRYRLDELPQLWNVLKGEMSLVGPRPEWVHEVSILEEQVPHYHLRHLVKPGITGWAQVNFRATSNAADSLEKLHYDLYYVKNISFALDMGILLKTVKRVCVHDLAVGHDRAQSAPVLTSDSSDKTDQPLATRA
ncbi:MAG: exopolysaccharide biosynthesis polyprenyl glycosylphosphotransferase [Elusimicrobia bacterium]|nr:exopolysaccharide biosynthesis polyprenyl glycosylphosphotransferase [Elusimicrobiota bacterium]